MQNILPFKDGIILFKKIILLERENQLTSRKRKNKFVYWFNTAFLRMKKILQLTNFWNFCYLCSCAFSIFKFHISLVTMSWFKKKFFVIVLGNSASNKSSILTWIVGNNFSRISWHLLQEVSSLRLGTLLLNNCLHRYPTKTSQLTRILLIISNVMNDNEIMINSWQKYRTSYFRGRSFDWRGLNCI